MTYGVADGDRVHFYTDLGALCGVSPPYRWSLNEARTTCVDCREMLEVGLRRRCAAGVHAIRKAVTLYKIRGLR